MNYQPSKRHEPHDSAGEAHRRENIPPYQACDTRLTFPPYIASGVFCSHSSRKAVIDLERPIRLHVVRSKAQPTSLPHLGIYLVLAMSPSELSGLSSDCSHAYLSRTTEEGNTSEVTPEVLLRLIICLASPTCPLHTRYTAFVRTEILLIMTDHIGKPRVRLMSIWNQLMAQTGHPQAKLGVLLTLGCA
jgi:hypothetical protein